MMRKRARERDDDEFTGGKEGGKKARRDEKKLKDTPVTESSGHINFFMDIQKGVCKETLFLVWKCSI